MFKKAFRSRVVAVSVGTVLAVGLGAGGAVAAGQIGTQDIRNQSIRQWDLHENSVGLSELNKYAQSKIESGGEQGPQGEPGADGQDGVSGYEVIGRGTDAATGTGQQQTVTSACAAGQQVFSGGVRSGTAGVVLHESYPSDIQRVGPDTEEDPSGLWAATSWTVEFTAPEGANVQPFVVCADIPQGD